MSVLSSDSNAISKTGGPSTVARVIWPPYPFEAGFCLCDDSDAGETEAVRAAYDCLKARGLVATRAIWVFPPEEPCGIPALPPSSLRGVTLADKEFLRLCLELRDAGFEFCMHGASAGNNRRGRTQVAFDHMERHFGPQDTFICHAKNADNIYWEEQTAPEPLSRALTALYSHHHCSGELPGSRYFWGDVCRGRVRQVRLFRTRNTNTLAMNPSMPYFEPRKPYVRGWFSATKRCLRDCTSEVALDGLRRQHGLTVLYQYLHRYANPHAGGVRPVFAESIERLAGTSSIAVMTVGAAMRRLRQIQALFGVSRGKRAWLANAGREAVDDVQVRFAAPGFAGGLVRIDRVEPGGVVELTVGGDVSFAGRRSATADCLGRAAVDFGFGRAFVNVGDHDWRARGSTVGPGTCRAVFEPGLESLRPFSRAGSLELYRLFLGQSQILGREYLLKGRRVSTSIGSCPRVRYGWKTITTGSSSMQKAQARSV